MNTKFTALYERLSRDDEQQGESNLIVNPKKYLEDYARSHGFKNVRHFSEMQTPKLIQINAVVRTAE